MIRRPPRSTRTDTLFPYTPRFRSHQPHQVADLLFGALPVFRRKGIERHRLDAEVAGGAHDRPHRFHPRAMAGDARQVALLRPAAVAVHDDGDMARAVMSLGHRRSLEPRSRSAERRAGTESVSTCRYRW